MGWDVGCHTHGDTRRAVEEHVGQARREHARLLRLLVVVGVELDRFFVDVSEKLFGNSLKARLGIPHSSRGIAVNAAPVTLTVYQRIAEREVLRHTGKSVVNRCIAVGVKLFEHLAYSTCALTVWCVVAHTHAMHRIQNASLHRLEPVSYVRESARNDYAHGVIEISRPHFGVKIYISNSA